MTLWDKFLHDEDVSRDVIGVKRIYIKMAGDVASGVMLSQIIYWFLPSKRGDKKTTIEFDGEDWIAKKLSDWDDECAMTPDQARRCLKVLEDKGFIVCKVRKFNGTPTTHIRIKTDAVLMAYKGGGAPDPLGQNPKSEMVDNPSPDGQEPISYNKEKITTETTAEILPLAALSEDDEEDVVLPKKRKDPRWKLIRADLKSYWDSKNRGLPMPWRGKVDGNALALFLEENPNLTQQMWLICLRNRFRSDVPHGDNIHRWIRQLLRFHEGPRDRFDQLKPANGASQKQVEQEQKINDTITNSAIARERILGKGREEVRTTGSIPGQVRPLLESSADNPGTDRGLVRRDPALHRKGD